MNTGGTGVRGSSLRLKDKGAAVNWRKWMLWAALGSSFGLRVAAADIRDAVAAADQWPGYGRATDESHYSPLSEINSNNVSHLGLAWSLDIPGVVLATSTPIEVAGTLYFAVGYSVVRAVEATTGRLLWTYDPEVPRLAGRKLRVLWGIRGLAYWEQRIYVGTHDGRLICLDAQTGRPLWSVSTTQPGDYRIITGPPLIFDGKVVIGHGVAEYGKTRGYVTAYDARSGRRLWRFYTVPGDPGRGFENAAMERAAKTWSGPWWRSGGGGTVWNAMAYDPTLRLLYIGTGNGTPLSMEARSPGGGDNLYLASIIALDGATGTYRWHYQVNPGETWDYDATSDIELADLTFDGQKRRILMQASKNGFFYVLDRESGKLIAADKFAHVDWAQKIDLQTGRPVEAPGARAEAHRLLIWPGQQGAHTLQPMAFSPDSGLVYIPVVDQADDYDETLMQDERQPLIERLRKSMAPYLLAWAPLQHRAVWRITLPGSWSAGVAATAGNLVFQGRGDGKFVAYAAEDGKELWTYDTQVGLVGAPITYSIAGKQYVSILSGYSGIAAMLGSPWSARAQPRRLLTFTLNGSARLPPTPPAHLVTAVRDPNFHASEKQEQRGERLWGDYHCVLCHGLGAVSGGAAPDLRESPSILSLPAFTAIVKNGALVSQGMPRFEELTTQDLAAIRQFVRARASELSRKSLATPR